MEMQMEQYIEGGIRRADEIFVEMKRFEDFYLSISDADESLLDKKTTDFNYADEHVQLMWACFRAGAKV